MIATENKSEFNYLRTLLTIEQDADLTDVFRKKVSMDFKTLKTVAKQELLSDETKKVLNSIYEHIILDNSYMLSKYQNLVETVTKPVTDSSKPPRRYGKDKIQADIDKQGGKPTEVQRAMLSVNRMKNIYVNLSARGRDDMLKGTKKLSDTDCREIIACVEILEKRLEEILKRKK